MNKKKTISIVIPVWNEEDAIPIYIDKIIPVLEKIPYSFEILFIDDGSEDKTIETILDSKENHPKIKLLTLSRNFGKEAALSAGIDFAIGNAVIPMDVDLQDPPEVIPKLIQKWEDGFDVVLAVRNIRKSDSLSKRFFSKAFYSFFNKVSQIKIIDNAGDFRLIDRIVVDQVKKLREKRRFMKGLLSWPGFKTGIIEFERAPRSTGGSKWKTLRLFSFAFDGIMSFSSFPLVVLIQIGSMISLSSFVYVLFLLYRTLVYGIAVPGYASLMVVTLFLGGFQLISLGILGRYIGIILDEVKDRPIYIIKDIY